MTALTIATYTIRECGRRRVFLVLPAVTVLFLGCYALGVHFAFRVAGQNIARVDTHEVAGATLTGLALFASLFLASILGVFLTFTTVRGDAEAGLLQPLVVRPISRASVVLGRLIGAAAVAVAYVLVLYGGSVLITGLRGGWWPDPIWLPALELAGGVVVVTALSLLGSVFLPSITNGIAILMAYGTALTAGFLSQLGTFLDSAGLRALGKVLSWALPFEALYQAALYDLTSDTGGLTQFVVRLGPLGGAQQGGAPLTIWTLAYLFGVVALTTWLFARRDV